MLLGGISYQSMTRDLREFECAGPSPGPYNQPCLYSSLSGKYFDNRSFCQPCEPPILCPSMPPSTSDAVSTYGYKQWVVFTLVNRSNFGTLVIQDLRLECGKIHENGN